VTTELTKFLRRRSICMLGSTGQTVHGMYFHNLHICCLKQYHKETIDDKVQRGCDFFG